MKTINLFVIVCLVLLVATNLDAAYLRFHPQQIIQPDGQIIDCFVSGDEHNNWLHDEAGYTIIQDPTTGYYTYAIPATSSDSNSVNSSVATNSNIKPSNLIVGVAQIPSTLSKWLIPSPKSTLSYSDNSDKSNIDKFNSNKIEQPNFAANTPKNRGNLCNIVIFIKFQQEDFKDDATYFDKLFNAKGVPSLMEYFDEVSYRQLVINSYIYPQPVQNKVVAYTDIYTRDYYVGYSQYNDIGYSTADERRSRKAGLLKRALEFASRDIPDTLKVDRNDDEYVDNVTFITSGSSVYNSIFLPSMDKCSNYPELNFSINEKKTECFNLIPYANLTLGAVCHEFFHTLGAPDLYRYSNVTHDPVYHWDLMDLDKSIPQSMCLYMKHKYGNWVDDIPYISLPGEYKINSLSSPVNNGFRVRSSNSMQYYVLEYRKPQGLFESSLATYWDRINNIYREFSGGLLVYRINLNSEGKGNASAGGATPDEVYVYRPDGTEIVKGKPDEAPFNSKYLRSAINANTNPIPFLFNGNDGGLRISNVYEEDSLLYFTLHSDDVTFIKYPEHLASGINLTPTIRWDLLPKSRTYRLQIALRNNFLDNEIVVNEQIVNDSIFRLQNALRANTIYHVRVGTVGTNGNVLYWSRTVTFTTFDKISITLQQNNHCVGQEYEIKYEFKGDLSKNNRLLIQLSDKSGVFSNPQNLTSISTKAIGYEKIRISDVPSGHHYRIRIISQTDPDIVATSEYIVIKNMPEVTINLQETAVCLYDISNISYQTNFEKTQNDFTRFELSVKNGIIMQNDTLNKSAQIAWHQIGVGEIVVSSINSLGCVKTFTRQVTINDNPTINFSGVGKQQVCAFSEISYYLPEERNPTITTTINVTNGEYTRINRDSIKIIWNDQRNGIIEIKKTSMANCIVSHIFPVTINTLPQAQIDGKFIFCSSDTATFFAKIDEPRLYDFLWRSENGEIIGVDINPDCTLHFKDAATKLNLRVTNKVTGCVSIFDTLVSIISEIEKPKISQVDNYLVCDLVAAEYQWYLWYLDDEVMTDATSRSIIPTIIGLYSVKIIDENGCSSAISDYFDFHNSIYDGTGREVDIIELDGRFIISVNSIENLDCELFDVLGRRIDFSKQALSSQSVEISINSIPAGLYFLKLFHNNTTSFYKLIVRE